MIIQWDGEYWHGHPSKLKDGIPDKRQNRRMKYDKSQNMYLTKCGYKILRFWESEVLKEYKGEDDYIRRTIQEVTRHLKQQFMRKEDGVVAGGGHPT